jgi:hypothetical protein
MTSIQPVSVESTRESVISKIPCPVIAAVGKTFPEVEITAEGINRQQFVDALSKRGFSPRLVKLLDGALRDAALASKKDGSHFDGNDLRHTAFFDGLSTFIFRNGFDEKRFNELMACAPKGYFDAPAIARMVRTLAKEQNAGLKAVLFTIAEYSAVRQTTVGANGKLDVESLKNIFVKGELGPLFHSAEHGKNLLTVGYSAAKTLACYGAQVALGVFNGNSDLPKLTPLPEEIRATFTGAAATLEPAQPGKCPMPWVHALMKKKKD